MMHPRFGSFSAVRVLRRLGTAVVLAWSVGFGALGVAGGTPSFLYSFQGSGDDVYPQGNLVRGSDGAFYGTARAGGKAHGLNGAGVIFKVSASGTMTTLHAFATDGSDGFEPGLTLVQGSDGAFYGTTATGGGSDRGTVFRVTAAGEFASLYSFAGGKDGASPTGLASGSDGSLYGTATLAGANGYGTIFRVTTGGNLTTLYAFTGGADGASPAAALVQGSDGSLYVTTPGSANGGTRGTVFRWTAAGTFSMLYAFTGGTDGDGHDAGVIQAADGALYEVTGRDGLANSSVADGTLFSLTPGGALTTLHTFKGATSGAGFTPHMRLAQGTDGNLYGTTVNGGASGYGTVFQFAVSSDLTTLVTPTEPTATVPVVAISAGGDGTLAQGSKKAKVRFVRTGNTSAALTVSYRVKSRAQNGTDFVGAYGAALNGTVTIPAGVSVYKLKVIAKAAPAQDIPIKFILKAVSDAAYTLGTPAQTKLILTGGNVTSF